MNNHENRTTFNAQTTIIEFPAFPEKILHAIDEGVYGIDSRGLTTFINPAAKAMTGWSEHDLIGKPIHDFHHHSKLNGSQYPQEQCPIFATTRTGLVHHVDNEVFWRKDGSCFPVEYTSTPVYRHDQLVGTVVNFRDISNHKRTKTSLRQNREQSFKQSNMLSAKNYFCGEEKTVGHEFSGIIGQSPGLTQLLHQVRQVGPTQSTVLIRGESGTGKELIARAIHNLSPRKNGPLIKVNCGALIANLVESELFGHEKGAFTGALQKRLGRFEQADGGTLFLDEIGELAPDIQVKLLRVLQEHEIEPVGSNSPTPVDVRIVAATHRDLQQMVEEQRFRMDLFYRLNVFPLIVPPLRERSSDIPLLTDFMLHKLSKKLDKPLQGVTPKTMNSLMNYSWPGNIRELLNILERAAIVSETPIIDITETFRAADQEKPDPPPMSTLAEAERYHIIRTLSHVDWVIAGKNGAAALLDVPPSTLRSRMKKLGIKRP